MRCAPDNVTILQTQCARSTVRKVLIDTNFLN